MNSDMPPDDTRLVPSLQGGNPEAAYVEGVATGYFGCIGAVVLAILGFVARCALVCAAHDNEWFYTQEEFRKRHELSDAGLKAWSNMVTGRLFGAVLLPIAGAMAFTFLRSKTNRGRE
jgi:hypothetical protein